MNLKSILSCSAIISCLACASIASAQDIAPNVPVDGQMVKLDAKRLWKVSVLQNLQVLDAEVISEGTNFPSISPDGTKVVLFERNPGENTLHEWSDQGTRKLISGEEVSNFITWSDNTTISMRERTRPFLRTTNKLRYNLNPSKVALRDKKPVAEETFVAYDENDVIILESKKTQTLQAISDTRADRYYSPIVSPDQRFVVFNGLLSGVHVFDIEQNAVVYIGAHGTNPSFSPDGRYLIYSKLTDDGHEFTSGDFVLVDLQERTFRFLSNPDHEIRTSATLSRNAQKISYATSDGKVRIASLPLL